MNREKLLLWLLRIAGAMEILAFVAVVMPRSWMEGSHAWLGMGAMPDGPLLMFMIRQASYTYGIHGLSLWLIATDVERFRPFIIFNGVAFLIAAPVFFLIDLTSGMPLWWAVGDPGSCGFFGAALLLLSRKPFAKGNKPDA
ncbi:MAG TPA: hypothetical protein VFI24_23720 [Pyrinomonadaceae bacterium]|nr:hypothetical protein [Pyrinomonadaceae bacterium]